MSDDNPLGAEGIEEMRQNALNAADDLEAHVINCEDNVKEVSRARHLAKEIRMVLHIFGQFKNASSEELIEEKSYASKTANIIMLDHAADILDPDTPEAVRGAHSDYWRRIASENLRKLSDELRINEISEGSSNIPAPD